MFLRGLAAAASLVAILRLLRYTEAREEPATFRAQCALVLTCAFVPYLSVRFSSEGISASLFAIAFTLLEPSRPGDPPPDRGARPLVGGVLLAAAFQARYQAVLMIAGYAAWRLLVARAPSRSFALPALGFLLGTGTALAIDAWGYGHAVFPFWGYVRTNMIEGVAAKFSREPFFAYLYLSVGNLFAIPAAVALVGSFVFWIRRPRDPFTWIMAPSFVAFSLIAHKEERFVFPLALFAALAVAPAFAGTRVFALRTTWPARAVWALQGVLMLGMALHPVQWRERVPLARVMKRTLGPTDVVYMDRAASTAFPALRGRFTERELEEGCAVPQGAFVLTSRPAPPMPGLALAYTEWPLGRWGMGLRAAMQSVADDARSRFGPVVQPVGWYGLYRVEVGRAGDRACPERSFVPIATRRP
jgi:phosphatidylinositol glycan class B